MNGATNWAEHGYLRVAAMAPPVQLGDPRANATILADWAARAGAAGAGLVVFPELALTGYSCEDLFLGRDLLARCEAALRSLLAATASLPAVLVVGLPVAAPDGRRYNAAAVLQGGRVHGYVPKTHLPNAGEFYERRWFTPAGPPFTLDGVPVSSRLLFRLGPMTLAVEICEDLWAPEPPSGRLALAGANVIANPSASNELVAKADYRRQLVAQQSARTHTAYVYAGSGPTESTKDVVFGGHCLVCENGGMLAESERFSLAGSAAWADVDLDKLGTERARNITWSTSHHPTDHTLVELGPSLPPAR